MNNNFTISFRKIVFFLFLTFSFNITFGQQKQYKVVAYISSDSTSLMQYDLKKVTHLIYGFAHLDNEGKLSINKKKDSVMLRTFAELKKKHPKLKTMIALGGWTGCFTCSATFSDKNKRIEFAKSTKAFIDYFKLDGIDLDWEYPAIKGPPEHLYQDQDKPNFTDLVIQLRKQLGKTKLITFAAGGFGDFFEKSIEWQKVNPYLDFVNLMSYDLVHGYSTETGHQSALYSNRSQDESIDRAVNFFRKYKFPLSKVVVGVPFYTRYFQVEDTSDNGLFKAAKFVSGKDYKNNKDTMESDGFVAYWDSTASVPYWFNAEKKLFATGDNKKSIKIKTDYIKKQRLGGIMFWELASDAPKDGLLDAIEF
ncbi:glycoside hydrolase [Elizabethkingia anophelis]|uniref:glycoside hydrolase family 18 protein n=1 Tax=Elizabethkingia anophelis TaxID=1117645 RepID=UPI00099944FF|nr:glycosyl hydrolase family 18 protein [Elizabethkingia anophelis]MCT4328890.1 glycoside hydrolase [Elizabethkingia anophelis]OPC44883.1 glycoside hydrolase [Elizabethkingia anophelis]